jgi:predicted component of type VI protein secretion system
MKKLVLILGICFVGIACNLGKEKQENNRVTKMIAKMTTACQLTPEQAGKIQPILATFIKTRIENKDKYASDQEALRKADSTIRKNYIDTLKTILSPEQYEKLKAFHARQKEDKQGGSKEDQDN